MAWAPFTGGNQVSFAHQKSGASFWPVRSNGHLHTGRCLRGPSGRRSLRQRYVRLWAREPVGATVAVQGDAILESLRWIGGLDLLPQITSATAVAGFDRLAQVGTIQPCEETVFLLPGKGIKNAGAIAEMYSAREGATHVSDN